MAFCSNCGNELVSGAKFCQKCGNSVGGNNTSEKIGQRMEYHGKVLKCPNCGEELKSFEMNCPACGLELRGTKATRAVKEFALKLEAIESRREYEKPSGYKAVYDAQVRISKTDEQKISLIQSFSVPNNKEDILEFMILATSNINYRLYYTLNTNISKGEQAINDAWLSKIRQVYDKARLSYRDDSDFAEIQRLYDECMKDICKSKKKRVVKWVLLLGWIPLVYMILIPALIIGNNNDNKKSEERLEDTVIEIEASIEAENYRQALMNAELLVYDGHDEDRERYWSVRQKYYIEEILEKAEEKGIKLNYVPIEIEEDESTNIEIEGSGFTKGFIDGFTRSFSNALDDSKNNE